MVVFLKVSFTLIITEKVSFNMASEASYVYIFSGQKFIKNAENAENGTFWRVFENLELAVKQCYRSVLLGQKIGGKCQNLNATFWVIFKQCVHA